MKDSISKLADGTIHQILHLQARVDALETLVQILALREGADLAGVRDTVKAVAAAAYQKRLEALEDLSPSVAARIDQRESIPDIDPQILDGLRFSDEKED